MSEALERRAAEDEEERSRLTWHRASSAGEAGYGQMAVPALSTRSVTRWTSRSDPSRRGEACLARADLSIRVYRERIREVVIAEAKYREPRAHALRERYLETFGGEEIPVPVEEIAENLLGLRVERSFDIEHSRRAAPRDPEDPAERDRSSAERPTVPPLPLHDRP